MVPKRRLDETRTGLEAENRRLQAQIAELLRTATPPAPPAPPPVDPADQAIKDRLEALYPELKRLGDFAKLASRSGDIDSAIDAGRQYEASREQFFERHTSTQLDTLQGKMAAVLLGEGKTAADLSDDTKQSITDGFAAWVFNRNHPERAARYDRLDTKLIDEYFDAYRTTFIDPVRRSQQASALTTHENRPALPVGGTSVPASPPAPPKPPADDEDAVHKRAWEGFKASLVQG